ncbi:hypothetical protein PZ894_19920 [Nocardioides sp. YIM 152315]|nr:hypothetical protein [Nocardioides sp. YIM 152315]
MGKELRSHPREELEQERVKTRCSPVAGGMQLDELVAWCRIDVNPDLGKLVDERRVYP